MDREAWIAYGIKHKFISTPSCDRHEGYPITAEEEAELDNGGDICVVVARVFDNAKEYDEAYANEKSRKV